MDREAIARIIDPEAWAMLDLTGGHAPTIEAMNRGRVAIGMPTFEERCAPSLAKADQILALSPGGSVPEGARAACEVAALQLKTRIDLPHESISIGRPLADRIHFALTQAAASPPAPVSGWRDIATAPKDGTDVLLAGAVPEGWRVTVGHWTTDEECRTPIGDCGGECRCIEYDYHDPSWISWDGGFCDPWPATHWQPLPAPPEQAPTPQGEGRGE